MDQRAHDVEEDVRNILQTRLALADKIQKLERHVEATVESTKMAALDALELAKNRAAGFIESATIKMRLLDSKQFDSGVTLLRFEPMSSNA